jgi:hypothetical protein
VLGGLLVGGERVFSWTLPPMSYGCLTNSSCGQMQAEAVNTGVVLCEKQRFGSPRALADRETALDARRRSCAKESQDR